MVKLEFNFYSFLMVQLKLPTFLDFPNLFNLRLVNIWIFEVFSLIC